MLGTGHSIIAVNIIKSKTFCWTRKVFQGWEMEQCVLVLWLLGLSWECSIRSLKVLKENKDQSRIKKYILFNPHVWSRRQEGWMGGSSSTSNHFTGSQWWPNSSNFSFFTHTLLPSFLQDMDWCFFVPLCIHIPAFICWTKEFKMKIIAWILKYLRKPAFIDSFLHFSVF